MKRARTSGELARRAGRGLAQNPYRKSSSTRSPRRGSWSEAFARQWALGWHDIDKKLREQSAPAASGDTGEKEALDRRDLTPAASTQQVPAKA